MTTQQDGSSKPTGFAGLDSLVSNVENDVAASPKSSPSHAQSEGDAKPPGMSDDAGSPSPISLASQEAARAAGAASTASGAHWVVVILLAFGALILFANIDRRSDVPAHLPAETPVASAASERVSPLQAPESAGEEMPPIGEGLVLSSQQIRWCVFEKARLETMKELVSAAQEVSTFNAYVGRYNERCSRFQYRHGVLHAVEQELNHEGRKLQGEGAERILSLRTSPKASESAEAISDQNRRAPQDQISSDVTKEEPAKAVGIAPAPQAKSEVDAAPLASTERDTDKEFEIVRSDFGLFSPPRSGKLVFQAAQKVPLLEGQGYGWYVQLRTTKPQIKWREEMVAPTPPVNWGIQGSPAQHSISEDRRTLTTEREVIPDRGLIYNVWAVAAGDPKGPHVVRVYVEGRLVRTFEFETE